MKKIQIISLCLIGLFLFSCGTSNNVVSKGIFSKRKVNKGYFYNPNRKIKNTSEEVTAEVRQPFIQYEEEIVSIEKEQFNTVTQEIESAVTSQVEDQIVATDVIETTSKTSEVEVNTNVNTLKENNPGVAKKSVINQSKKTLKKYKENNSSLSLFDILILILCFVIPFLAVFLSEGTWNKRCWINLILCLLFVLPGIIHALIVCF